MPIRRRPLLLALTTLPAFLSGCALLPSGEGPDGAAAEGAKAQESTGGPKKAEPPRRKSPAKKKPAGLEPLKPVDAAPPVFMPALSDAPRLTLDQQIRIVFHEKALASGAPRSIPTLRALVLTDPAGVRAALTAMGLNVWTLFWNGAEIRESRSPRLDDHVSAERFLRDLAFTLWPAECVGRSLPADCQLALSTQPAFEIRTLLRGNVPLLRAVSSTSNGRRMITIENAIEGYTLQIESVE